MSDTYVIDGMNVCWWFSQANSGKISVKPLLTLVESILKNGDDFYCVFDASVTFELKDRSDASEAAIVENFLAQHGERFFRVTGATRADGPILHNANHNNRRIITNDTYRDYKENYPWLSDKYTERLIQGNLQSSGLMTLDKLHYGNMKLVSDVSATAERIDVLLAAKKSPKITELEKQIQLRQLALADLDKQLQTRQKSILELDGYLRQTVANRKKQEQDLRTAQTRAEELRSKQVELASVSAELERLHGVRDFDAIEAQMRDKISKLKSDTVALEEAYRAREREFIKVCEEAKAYQRILDQKATEENVARLEVQDIQACIRKANAEIAAFLEPHQIGRAFRIEIPFQGSSWDVAMFGVEKFFEGRKICTKCYDIRSTPESRCQTCGAYAMSDIPTKILEIINNNAPPGGRKFNINLKTAGKLVERVLPWVIRGLGSVL